MLQNDSKLFIKRQKTSKWVNGDHGLYYLKDVTC